MPLKKQNKKLRLTVKIFLCLVYISIIAVLVFVSFKLYEKDTKIVKWKDVTTTKEYSYIKISEMSEAFAVINKNIQIHFVIEKDKDKSWRTYLIAIDKKDYNKYKSIVDYTYERTKEEPKSIKVYGYPRKITKNIQSLAIKNIKNFVPVENKVELTDKNFKEYLTNTYLDTTIPKRHDVDNIILTLLSMAGVLFILIVFTLLDRDKIVDEVDELLRKELKIEKEKRKNTTKNKQVVNKKTQNNKKIQKENPTRKTKKKIDDEEVI